MANSAIKSKHNRKEQMSIFERAPRSRKEPQHEEQPRVVGSADGLPVNHSDRAKSMEWYKEYIPVRRGLGDLALNRSKIANGGEVPPDAQHKITAAELGELPDLWRE